MDNVGQLLIRISKLHRATIADRFSKLDLYPGQGGLLYHLSQNDGMTMSDLVDKLNIKHSTLFTMVNRMEKTEFVKKEKDENDKRISRIFLTNKGKNHVEQLTQIWHDIENQLLKGFTKEEKTMTTSILHKLINNLSNE